MIPNTITINLLTGVITTSPIVRSRETVAVALTGTGTVVNSNVRMALMRKGTIVATCQTFTGPGNAFVGTLSLNTNEVISEFDKARDYEERMFDLLVFDAATFGYLIIGKIAVQNCKARDASLPGNVSPISSGTTSWGNMSVEGGVVYIYNTTDGKRYPITLAGAGEEVHVNIDEDGGINP